VGSDRNKANEEAVELLKKNGYAEDTQFELLKVSLTRI
jgi:hypothetical protein